MSSTAEQRAVERAAIAGLVRRFCSCAFGRAGERCIRCGLERPRTGWSITRLENLRKLMRQHGSLAVAAELLHETRHHCNLAIDALSGRTPTHALAVLEARAERRR